MSEFTKEELDTIAVCISLYAQDDPEGYMPLFDKICSLSNKYCEHKNTDDCKSCNSVECEDCGERW